MVDDNELAVYKRQAELETIQSYNPEVIVSLGVAGFFAATSFLGAVPGFAVAALAGYWWLQQERRIYKIGEEIEGGNFAPYLPPSNRKAYIQGRIEELKAVDTKAEEVPALAIVPPATSPSPSHPSAAVLPFIGHSTDKVEENPFDNDAIAAEFARAAGEEPPPSTLAPPALPQTQWADPFDLHEDDPFGELPEEDDDTPLLDMGIFREYPTVLIYGSPGSGKTTFARAVAAQRAKAEHKIFVLDPHGNPRAWLYPLVGAGKNYKAIASAIGKFEKLVQFRYQEFAHGRTEFPPVTFVCDEVTQWAVHLPDEAAALFRASVSDTRKLNIGTIYISHGRTMTCVGAPNGMAAVRDSTMLELNLETEPDASNGGKARPTGYCFLKLPGGSPLRYRTPSYEFLVAQEDGIERQQPKAKAQSEDPRKTKLRELRNKGLSKTAAIAEAFDTSPGGSKAYAAGIAAWTELEQEQQAA